MDGFSTDASGWSASSCPLWEEIGGECLEELWGTHRYGHRLSRRRTCRYVSVVAFLKTSQFCSLIMCSILNPTLRSFWLLFQNFKSSMSTFNSLIQTSVSDKIEIITQTFNLWQKQFNTSNPLVTWSIIWRFLINPCVTHKDYYISVWFIYFNIWFMVLVINLTTWISDKTTEMLSSS